MRLRFVVVFFVIVSATVVIAEAKLGTVNGSVVFFSETGAFGGIVPSATIQVTVEDLRGEFTTDKMGDFNKTIPVGKYTITGVVGCNGEQFVLDKKQQRTFEVLPNQDKRIDIMLKTPERPYQCAASSN